MIVNVASNEFLLTETKMCVSVNLKSVSFQSRTPNGTTLKNNDHLNLCQSKMRANNWFLWFKILLWTLLIIIEKCFTISRTPPLTHPLIDRITHFFFLRHQSTSPTNIILAQNSKLSVFIVKLHRTTGSAAKYRIEVNISVTSSFVFLLVGFFFSIYESQLGLCAESKW